MSISSPLPDWQRHYNALSAPVIGAGISRRRFLQGLLATGALTATGAATFMGAEMAAAMGSAPLGPTDRILVVVMMGGGNDGFSMTIPAEDGRYVAARKALAISPGSAIPLADGLYWHSACNGISDRYNAGDVAVVQGIGDPADDRSHFSSMARWMRGMNDSASYGFTGWLGRWLDGAGLGGLGGISIGNSGVPLHMRGFNSSVTALPTQGNLFGASAAQWEIHAFDALRAIDNAGAGGPWYSAVSQAVGDALNTATVVAPVYDAVLPENYIQRDLALAAETINLDIGARVITVGFGDFDTHDDHASRYNDLMVAFDQGVSEFFSRLRPDLADRVALMTFSEFGRSWTANDSAGIDHGTASTALVMGNGVAGGLYGEMPNFDVMDADGDLESTVDFRSYYATVLDGWLAGDSQSLLGGNYENLGIFAPEGTPTGMCAGLQATIVGTALGEVINGTPARDIIDAGGGDDTIYGLDGDDLICGGEGTDVIWGGAGNDQIIAGGGNDIVRGEADADVIDGNAGDDRIWGGQAADTIHGNEGADTIHGNRGADRLFGDDGDDRIYGYSQNDDIQGGAGNDRLHGNYGDDGMQGGPGNDRIFGYGDNDHVTGGQGDDLIGGNFGDDLLEGNDGNDTIYGSDGADTVSGGAGNDSVDGNSGPDTVLGGQGDDKLDGGIDVDTCNGGPGTDTATRCENVFEVP